MSGGKISEGTRISHGAWTDEHEIVFIRQLEPQYGSRLSRLDVLLRYRESIKRRNNWGGLNKDRILAALAEEIEQERKKCPC
jgi:hypothetical protein